MGKKELIFFGILSLAILLPLLHYFVFNIYETTFKLSSNNLYADFASTIEIETIPINSLGFRVPLKNSPADFEILEGSSLIEIAAKDSAKGIFRIRAKGEIGKVVVRVKPKYSLLPTIFEFNILQSVAHKI